MTPEEKDIKKILEEQLERIEFDVLNIKRVATGKYGTWGAMLFKDIPFAVTLEDPDKHLEPGVYRCMRSYYYRGDYETFEIHNKSMTRVLFHKGNWATNFNNKRDDSDACILIGESFEPVIDTVGIKDSTHGFNEFMKLFANTDRFVLKIEECY